MKQYLDCWIETARGLFSQALAGEPELLQTASAEPPGDAFGFMAVLGGDVHSRFTVQLSGSLLEAPLLGDGEDQKTGWEQLLRETVEAAASEFSLTTGRRCRVESFEEIVYASELELPATKSLELRSGERVWPLWLRDELHGIDARAGTAEGATRIATSGEKLLRPGLDLLLDVELEAALRFGSRELPLGEILDLGPGDVVQLDRHVSDPVDLIVADKIVARGEVVLVNGNFGLRVTEVASPRMRLESIRCLF